MLDTRRVGANCGEVDHIDALDASERRDRTVLERAPGRTASETTESVAKVPRMIANEPSGMYGTSAANFLRIGRKADKVVGLVVSQNEQLMVNEVFAGSLRRARSRPPRPAGTTARPVGRCSLFQSRRLRGSHFGLISSRTGAHADPAFTSFRTRKADFDLYRRPESEISREFVCCAGC
jgi:hypothetical protein